MKTALVIHRQGCCRMRAWGEGASAWGILQKAHLWLRWARRQASRALNLRGRAGGTALRCLNRPPRVPASRGFSLKRFHLDLAGLSRRASAERAVRAGAAGRREQLAFVRRPRSSGPGR